MVTRLDFLGMLNLKLFTSAESHLLRHDSILSLCVGNVKTPYESLYPWYGEDTQQDIEWICRICRRSPFWADFSQGHAGDAVSGAPFQS